MHVTHFFMHLFLGVLFFFFHYIFWLPITIFLYRKATHITDLSAPTQSSGPPGTSPRDRPGMNSLGLLLTAALLHVHDLLLACAINNYYVKQGSIHFYVIVLSICSWYSHWTIKTETSLLLHPFIQNVWKSARAMCTLCTEASEVSQEPWACPHGTSGWMCGTQHTALNRKLFNTVTHLPRGPGRQVGMKSPPLGNVLPWKGRC